jgi:hypothetical protein
MRGRLVWRSRIVEHSRLVEELRAARIALGLKGLADETVISVLAWQFIASIRREDYYRLIQRSPISVERTDPNGAVFCAERAVAYHKQQGNIDEACWLIFLMTHFAKRSDTGWLMLQSVYGQLGKGIWDWLSVSKDPEQFYQWLGENWKSIPSAFGNHRKYESRRPDAKRPISRAVEDYLRWIEPGGHGAFFANAVRSAGNNPATIFHYLYANMAVTSFGRLAKFDYLSLLGRYRLAPIVAGSAYLDGATGPGRGARLLLDGNPESNSKNTSLQTGLDGLDALLGVGMSVMEDALCNWQKSPHQFVHFKG